MKYPVTFYAFGSRVKGTARPLSDLDLCIKDPIHKSVLVKILEEFEESDLPFKVDIILWSEISENFQKQIEKDLLPLEFKD
jgi:predicted nucleotidyltransferase